MMILLKKIFNIPTLFIPNLLTFKSRKINPTSRFQIFLVNTGTALLLVKNLNLKTKIKITFYLHGGLIRIKFSPKKKKYSVNLMSMKPKKKLFKKFFRPKMLFILIKIKILFIKSKMPKSPKYNNSKKNNKFLIFMRITKLLLLHFQFENYFFFLQ